MDEALADDAGDRGRLITEPLPRFFIGAMPCFMPKKTPVALMSISRFQAAVS